MRGMIQLYPQFQDDFNVGGPEGKVKLLLSVLISTNALGMLQQARLMLNYSVAASQVYGIAWNYCSNAALAMK